MFPFNVLQKIDGVGMDFSRDDVPMDKISVREAVKFVSIAGAKDKKLENVDQEPEAKALSAIVTKKA